MGMFVDLIVTIHCYRYIPSLKKELQLRIRINNHHFPLNTLRKRIPGSSIINPQHIRRRHPKRRILLKEIRRPQHDRNRLGRHNREILRAREMRQPKLHKADDIAVLDGLVARGPVHHRLVLRVSVFPRRLADVFARWEEFVFAVGYDPEGFAREAGAVIDRAAWFGEHGGTVVVEDLVGDGLFGDRVEVVGVDDVPAAACFVAVVHGGFLGGA